MREVEVRGSGGESGEMQSSSGARNTSTQKEKKLSRARFNILLGATLAKLMFLQKGKKKQKRNAVNKTGKP